MWYYESRIRIEPDWNVKFIEWFIANVAPLLE